MCSLTGSKSSDWTSQSLPSCCSVHSVPVAYSGSVKNSISSKGSRTSMRICLGSRTASKRWSLGTSTAIGMLPNLAAVAFDVVSSTALFVAPGCSSLRFVVPYSQTRGFAGHVRRGSGEISRRPVLHIGARKLSQERSSTNRRCSHQTAPALSVQRCSFTQ